jgi:hypothetical protein
VTITLYSTTIALYYVPKRLKSVRRRIVFESAPLEAAARELHRAIDPVRDKTLYD